MPDYKQMGLFQRYEYVRTDGKPNDAASELLTLDYGKDGAYFEACRRVARFAADELEQVGYVQMAKDLRERVAAVEARITEVRKLEARIEKVQSDGLPPIPHS